ncbi:MAG: hypothetical protein OQJ93_14445, partial [Ignavibacteriaceae bacterium]|nr:hypothetical protein [Ignavibacteriaceae bacterium]
MKKILLPITFLLILSNANFSQTYLSSDKNQDGNNYLFFNEQKSSTEHINQIVPDWIYDTKAPILSGLKSADVNGDGIKEIVVSTFDTTDGNPYG